MNKTSDFFVTKLLTRVHKGKYSEEELYQGVKNIDPEIIRFMKSKNIGSVKKMINTYNPGRYLEAEDVIQEALVILVENIRNSNFNRQSKLNTYFFGICKNVCLKAVRKDQKLPFVYYGERQVDEDESSFTSLDNITSGLQEYDPARLLEITVEIIKEMEAVCRRMFDLRFGLLKWETDGYIENQKKGFTEIAEIMEMTEVNARQKFHRCLSRLWVEFQKRKNVYN
jgi:RNA polymerase sigma factor (sigma-70 family)